MFNSVKGEHGSALASRGVFKKHLILIVSFLFLGNLSALADCWHFAGNGNHSVVNNPSYDRPYLRFTAMYYDATSGNNGYFVLQKPTKSGTIPSNAPAGPALFINGQYACSPIAEFGWNDDDGGAWKAAGNDSWWGNTYKATIDGITYTIKFYNPYHDGDSKRVYVHVIIFPNALPHGQETKVTIAGMWKMNRAQKTPVEESYTGYHCHGCSDAPDGQRTAAGEADLEVLRHGDVFIGPDAVPIGRAEFFNVLDAFHRRCLSFLRARLT